MNRFHREMIQFCDEVSSETAMPQWLLDKAAAIRRRLEGRTTSVPSAAFKGPTLAEDRAIARTERNATTASIRKAVKRRARGCCEACGGRTGSLQMDHFFGGSSRSSSTTVEGCWMLCDNCHHNKTDNAPTRQKWLDVYRDHCDRYRYDTQLIRLDIATALQRAKNP